MKKIFKIFIIGGVLVAAFIMLNHFDMAFGNEAYISITFDDSYDSQYDAAAILESYGWRGTFYVPSGLISGEFEDRQLMDWSQIEDLQERGHEIGAHTLSHVRASDVPEDIYNIEVLADKKILEEKGISAESFAYPYGDDIYKHSGKNFVTARTTKVCINEFSDRELCGLTLVHEIGEYKILAYFLAQLQKNGGWLVIVIHDITDENFRQNVDITKADFIWILEQIKNSGIQVKTIAGVVNGV